MLSLRLISVLCYLLAVAWAVWPQPQHHEYGSGLMWLSPNLTDIALSIERGDKARSTLGAGWSRAQQILGIKPARAAHGDEEWEREQAFLREALERFKKDVSEWNIVPKKFYPRGQWREPACPSDDPDTECSFAQCYIDKITLTKVSTLAHRRRGAPASQEAYWLHMGTNGRVHIEFEGAAGALYALQTLAQLFHAHSRAPCAPYTRRAPATIYDGPSFAHRGLNLDVARNPLAPADVRRTLDAMAFNKLNRLHLHAADAQSWPLEIPALPQLAAAGAYDAEQVWTAAQLRDVQAYGAARGVVVYVEIDLPGHATAIGRAFPELVVAANHEDWSRYALEPPAGQLKLDSPGVYPFLDKLLADLLPRVAPFSGFFHVGGDEVNRAAYELEPAVNASDPAVLKPLIQALVDHLVGGVHEHGLTPVVWEEVLLDWNLTLPAETVVQTWRDNGALAAVLERGHRALFGANPYWYLDCGFGGFLDPDPNNPNSPVKPPYLDYCTTYRNWRHVLAYDPLDGIPEARRHMVLGGEAHLWAELTDSITLDGMLWPRLSAAAEVLWSGPGRPVDEDATRRLAEMRERLVARGVRAGMVQMEWCLRERGKCRL